MTDLKPKRENLLVNLICNIGIPTLVLTKFSDEGRLGPVWGLVVALIFPLAYGVYDYSQRRRTNFISIVGFASVLLTGGLGLFKVSAFWFAVKDAAVPGLIGLGVLASLRSKTPIVREIFYNEQIIDVTRVSGALTERNQHSAFDRLMNRTSLWLFGAFMLSAVLNFVLARYILKSEPGTPAFNAEIGRMHVVSLPVITVPCMVVMLLAFWRLIVGLKQLTGLTADEIFRGDEKK